MTPASYLHSEQIEGVGYIDPLEPRILELRERAIQESRALRFISYTGDQPDITKEGISRIADLITELTVEVLLLTDRLQRIRRLSRPVENIHSPKEKSLSGERVP